jgi:glycosyltransferase involved in cell wall biosynthesis
MWAGGNLLNPMNLFPAILPAAGKFIEAKIMLIFTSCMSNYLPKARTLAKSVKLHNPDWRFCLLLGDVPPEDFNVPEEPFDFVLGFEELGIPNFKRWLFKYSVVEACTAAKPQAFRHFFSKGEAKVIYLDPDIQVFDSLKPLEDLLDSRDILLTPHLLSPQPDFKSIIDNEISALRHGIYNLGFLAVAGRKEGKVFADWWSDRTFSFCYNDIPNGIFTDQRWIDFVPAYFSSVHVLREPRYNAASWNLTDRVISFRDGQYYAGSERLAFYHFTGYDSGEGRKVIAYYARNMPAVFQLWGQYGQQLAANGQSNVKPSGSHMAFDNGVPITQDMRVLYGYRPYLQQLFPEPFQSGAGSYYEWYISNRDKLQMDNTIDSLGDEYYVASVCKAESGDLFTNELQVIKSFLEGFFTQDKRPVCIIDHQYGGGACDYRDKLARGFLDDGRTVLLLTWDVQRSKAICQILHGAAKLTLLASDLKFLHEYDGFHFEDIVVNEFVTWMATYENETLIFSPLSCLELIEDAKNTLRKYNARLTLPVHDYYSICPKYNLINQFNIFCGLPAAQQECATCLSMLNKSEITNPFYGVLPDTFSLQSWRLQWQSFFDEASAVVFFSEVSHRLICGIFTIKEERIRVEPHKAITSFPRSYIFRSGPMVIASIGNVTYAKGGKILEELTQYLGPDERLIVLGELVDKVDIKGNVTLHGAYERERLPELLRDYGVTVGLIPSVCPETFNLVSVECIQIGLPLVSFNVGAHAERIEAWEHGLLAESISAEAAYKALKALDSRRNGA